MNAELREYYSRLLANGYVGHLLMVSGFVLAFFLIARLMSEKKAPANTFAWLLAILFVPYLGVPLFLLFGGRKLRRLAKRKGQLLPTLPIAQPVPTAHAASPVAHTVTAAGGTPPVGGNAMRLLATGEDEFGTLARLIGAAQHSIHITTFILGRDETGRKLIELLARRAQEGVKVRLLLDALGCFTTRSAFVNPLRAAGGEVGVFMPVLPFSSRSSANLRNHRKISIFDHATAIVGGRNLTRQYMGPFPYRKRWRDFGAEIQGPAAALLNEVFLADWCFATRQSPEILRAEIPSDVIQLRGEAELQVVASGPDVPGDPLYEGIIAMIQEAEKNLWIVTPYFIPDDVLLRSLIVKARAGREVTLVVPARSNHPVTDYARRHYTRELRRAGGRVLLYTEGMMHSKVMIVDDRIALVGSANFDLRSLFVNFEIGVMVHSLPEVQQLRAWVDELVLHCVEAPPRLQRGRFLGGVAEDLSRLLAPLL